MNVATNMLASPQLPGELFREGLSLQPQTQAVRQPSARSPGEQGMSLKRAIPGEMTQ